MSRQLSYRKLQCTGRGHVAINFSFPSGMDEAGAATDPNMVGSDGYLVCPDGYTEGVYGIIKRPGPGEYEVTLIDRYHKFISAQGCVASTSNKAAFVQFSFPVMEAATDSNSEGWQRFIVRIVNGSGICTDLAYNDLVMISLVVDRSSA